VYKVLFKTRNEKSLLGKHKRRWEDTIKIVLKGIGSGLDLSGSGYRPVAISCEHYTGRQSLIRKPWNQTRFGNRNFSDFGILEGLGVRSLAKVFHSLSVLIGKYCSLRCLF
jgi:hypothetical protein